jgi:hypothetical protein
MNRVKLPAGNFHGSPAWAGSVVAVVIRDMMKKSKSKGAAGSAAVPRSGLLQPLQVIFRSAGGNGGR